MYFANRAIEYNKIQYQVGESIPDFGIGKYDDILLGEEIVGSDGVGTGVEDKIAKQKQWRDDHMTNLDDEIAMERRDMAEARRQEAEFQRAIAAKEEKTGVAV